MESVTQFALGAAVTVAAMGGRTTPWRAVLWGGVVATLPDLDVLFRRNDAVQQMISHRAESHALFWLTVVSPLLAFGIAAVHREQHLFRRWWWAVWLALVTHPLLDAMTIYGTRLLLPFSDEPLGLGSLFIVDPLYTLPLLTGLGVVLWRRGSPRARRWNIAGLVVSTLYAAWSIGAWQQALAVARGSLRDQGITAEQVMATAAPLQTVLWRLVATDADNVWEAHWSWFDGKAPIEWTRIDRGRGLREALRSTPAVDDLAAFSNGYWKVWREGDRVLMADVRMGMEPHYVFTFAVGRVGSPVQPTEPSVLVGTRIDASRGLSWLWQRALGDPLPPPR
jgi:inner membrane protein